VRSLPVLDVMPLLVAAGVGVVAAASVTGAWLARWRPGAQQVWFGAAAGALLVIAGVHLLPDAWSDAGDAHLPLWVVPAAAAGSFVVSGLTARHGCTCRADEEHLGGAGAAGALAAHRFFEGTALALTGAISVAVALAVHALGEGLAVGALLAGRSRARLAGWLSLMCLAPAAGAAAADAYRLPAAAGPVVVAVAAGILVQAARISLRAAFDQIRPHALLWRPAAALAAAAAITALAVHATG
jgi:zinc transporter ZupT